MLSVAGLSVGISLSVQGVPPPPRSVAGLKRILLMDKTILKGSFFNPFFTHA